MNNITEFQGGKLCIRWHEYYKINLQSITIKEVRNEWVSPDMYNSQWKYKQLIITFISALSDLVELEIEISVVT